MASKITQIWDQASGSFVTTAALAASRFGDMTGLTRNLRTPKGTLYMHGDGFAAGEALLMGIAHGELTATEIEASIESAGEVESDVAAREAAIRPVFPLGLIDEKNPSADFEWTRPWTWLESQGWRYWGYNPTAAALAGTVEVSCVAKFQGVWV